MAFESILISFGPLLDTLGRLWASFLAFKSELLWHHGLQMAFWIDFESILAGFGEDLDASGGSSGALKIETFASRNHFLNTLGDPCCLTLCYRNPRVASLRLAERHNF